MRQRGFTYIEVLVSLFLLLNALLLVGEMNMTSLRLISKARINRQATLLLLQKIEDLRVTPIESLSAGDYEELSGAFLIQWKIQNDTPYFGTKQLTCRVVHQPASGTIVESIFYRSE